MRRFLINFRQTARARAAQFSNQAFQHYLRAKPIFVKIQSAKGKIQNYNSKFKSFFGKPHS
jgi:hypothetical protein